MTSQPGLRERKKERTRQALVDAATTLFASKGYDETTIADLAAAADVSPRTFFSHFASKEEVLVSDPPLRLQTIIEVLAGPRSAESPGELLLRALITAVDQDDDLVAPARRRRAALILRTPSLQVGVLRKIVAVQRKLTRTLLSAYADELDPATAAALVGAMVGALVGALSAVYAELDVPGSTPADPERIRARLRTALTDTCRRIGGAA